MSPLAEYVVRHAQRGECGCGKCIDRGDAPEPEGHVVDMVFFKVGLSGEPSAEEFRSLTAGHRGDYGDVDPFDGSEHSFLDLGGWIGDQGLAMQYMALGALLGVFELLTPARLGIEDPDLAMKMAEHGFVTVLAK